MGLMRGVIVFHCSGDLLVVMLDPHVLPNLHITCSVDMNSFRFEGLSHQ